MTTFASSFDAAVASPLLGLLETLILGNISGGTDIVMTSCVQERKLTWFWLVNDRA